MHTHTHTNWESCREVAPSYNIISFECFLRFIQQSAITILPFSIPPLEKRDNIYVTWQNTPKPLYVLSLMFCITVDAEGRRRIMPHYIIWHSERRCAPFVWMQALSSALTRSFALPPDRANLCPPSRCRNYPLSRQASSRFTHIPYIPPLRGCRSDQRNSCKNMAGWWCPRLYVLWELSAASHH